MTAPTPKLTRTNRRKAQALLAAIEDLKNVRASSPLGLLLTSMFERRDRSSMYDAVRPLRMLLDGDALGFARWCETYPAAAEFDLLPGCASAEDECRALLDRLSGAR